MPRRVTVALAFAAVIGLVPTVFADTDLKPTKGYRQWFHVNTMIVDKSSPLNESLGGMHNVYINAVGLPALKKGTAFPDKTIFTTDLHEFTVKDGSMSRAAARPSRSWSRTRRNTRRRAAGASRHGPAAIPRSLSSPTRRSNASPATCRRRPTIMSTRHTFPSLDGATRFPSSEAFRPLELERGVPARDAGGDNRPSYHSYHTCVLWIATVSSATLPPVPAARRCPAFQVRDFWTETELSDCAGTV